jgi:septal ring factor EnvC (AmiA/AmiB activator)
MISVSAATGAKIADGPVRRWGLSFDAASRAFDAASWVLLIAFVLGALAVVAMIKSVSEEHRGARSLLEQSQAQVARMESEGSRADRSIAELREQVSAARAGALRQERALGSANERATRAERHAAELRTELERHTRARLLTAEQQRDTAERLRAFRGVPFSFAVAVEPDAFSLMGQIGKALSDAGWEWMSAPAPLVFETAATANPAASSGLAVQILVDERRAQEWGGAAVHLRDALRSAGLAATAEAARAGAEPATAIRIRISGQP